VASGASANLQSGGTRRSSPKAEPALCNRRFYPVVELACLPRLFRGPRATSDRPMRILTAELVVHPAGQRAEGSPELGRSQPDGGCELRQGDGLARLRHQVVEDLRYALQADLRGVGDLAQVLRRPPGELRGVASVG